MWHQPRILFFLTIRKLEKGSRKFQGLAGINKTLRHFPTLIPQTHGPQSEYLLWQVPSKNRSRLYLSPRSKATSNPPFLCWSPPISADSSQPLSVEIFISSYCTPTWALASSSTTLCPHLLSTRCLTQWGLGHSPTPHPHTMSTGPFYTRHHCHLVKAALCVPFRSVWLYNPQHLLSHRHPLSLVTVVH